MKLKAFLLLILCSLAISAVAQVKIGDKGEISGLAYSDYYWITSNHNESLEGNNGFWFRRIYLTYDHEVSQSFSTRLRLEMNGEGDFVTSAKMAPIVKDAWLKWENNRHEILAGISPTPTFSLVKDTWGYRSVEETPLNLQNFGSSRDFGIAGKGTLDEDERWNYHGMVGNGHSNNAAEINQGKKIMLALSYQLTERWIVELYGDWNDLSDEQYWTTVQGFLGYRTEDLNVGALYAYQHRNLPGLIGDANLDIASIFARASISQKTGGFLRIDHMFDPNPAGEDINYIPFSNNAKSTLLIGGIDFTMDTDIHLIPNFEAVFYGETFTGTMPKSDLIPRLTLYYQF
ncbi:hypothetical protein SAMN05443144_1363 [Fodinibius roseus]|uniref:Uncharacterized protein n=1 Tax=Fodinibius roseus TaxID=1194090 RepID=A0A1M5KZS1_9BACT|nr:hypothetical protein [Fodinibius roseus]SHG58009.1 hypothetical protein SAMN05443144_1363 [Fodinibius roseus]